MTEERIPPPRDPLALDKLIGDIATGQVEDGKEDVSATSLHAQTERLSDRLLAIGKECAARMKEPYRSADHADLLYGDSGTD